MKIIHPSTIASVWLFALAASAVGADQNPFDAAVLDARPRVFLRHEPFAGLTIEKLRSRIGAREFTSAREKWPARPLGRGLLWLLEGKQPDLEAALVGLKTMDASQGTWSDRGPALVRLATLFDWLYNDLDDPTRQETIRKIETAADDAMVHLRRGRAPFFYSRTPGALAGVCLAGLALSGVSPKADDYLQIFREFGVHEYFRAYQWVDGAATGATYTLNYTFVDLPSICAAWWSATDHNPDEWIQREQGDWLNGLVRFYLWYMRPGFAFTDINDQFRGNWDSYDEFCQGLDIASYVTRNRYGRAWSQRWLGRFGSRLYHREYACNMIFRDPEIAAGNLAELPHAELFGRDSCGYGFFRSSWPNENQPDTATHVFFRAGDPMNVHGGVAAGEFQVFKFAPLAARSGHYGNYDSAADQYHRNCISTNVVLFTDPDVPNDRGDQNTRRGLKTDHATWADWLRIRERNQMDVAQIVEWQVHRGEVRCRADLTKTVSATKCKQWIREFVWLADKHLVVLDAVETSRPEITRQWQLHAPTKPEVGNRLLTVTNQAPDQQWAVPALRPKTRTGRLYCQTILPRDYTLILHDAGEAERFTPAGTSLGHVDGNPFHKSYGQCVAQIEPLNHDTRAVFLHVLTATDADEQTPPVASLRATEGDIIKLWVDGTATRLDLPN